MRLFINNWVLMGYPLRRIAVVFGLISFWGVALGCSSESRFFVKNELEQPIELYVRIHDRKSLLLDYRFDRAGLAPAKEEALSISPAFGDEIIFINFIEDGDLYSVVIGPDVLKSAGCRVVVSDALKARVRLGVNELQNGQVIDDPSILNPSYDAQAEDKSTNANLC